jgi:hypothetical protein
MADECCSNCRKWRDEAHRLSLLGKKAQQVMREQRDRIRELEARDPLSSFIDDMAGGGKRG